jgi:sporadic carbohydrate cluster protein (TIGR04323 family)
VTSRAGYRGYLFSRSILGHRVPQHIQNLVMRDYCQRHSLAYKLGAVEHAMDGSSLILEQILADLPNLEGIVLYSMFMLPPDAARRAAVYRRVV